MMELKLLDKSEHPDQSLHLAEDPSSGSVIPIYQSTCLKKGGNSYTNVVDVFCFRKVTNS